MPELRPQGLLSRRGACLAAVATHGLHRARCGGAPAGAAAAQAAGAEAGYEAMETYLLDWANLLLRWAHVIVAIAWIGSSFYFVFLDNSLLKPQDPDLLAKGVDGELWAVHGGGFYNPQKYMVAPKSLPDHLHWFFWESYSTWLTGFALFTVLYLFNASSFLIDKNVHDLSLIHISEPTRPY